MNSSAWASHPAFQHMDSVKRNLLLNAAKETKGKSGKDLAPILFALVTTANREGIRFSTDEIDLMLSILKEGKSKKEQLQIDHTVQMIRSLL